VVNHLNLLNIMILRSFWCGELGSVRRSARYVRYNSDKNCHSGTGKMDIPRTARWYKFFSPVSLVEFKRLRAFLVPAYRTKIYHIACSDPRRGDATFSEF